MHTTHDYVERILSSMSLCPKGNHGETRHQIGSGKRYGFGQPCWRLLMRDHLSTVLVAASGDPGAGKGLHEFSGRIWALCKRNATSRNAIIYYRNTNT